MSNRDIHLPIESVRFSTATDALMTQIENETSKGRTKEEFRLLMVLLVLQKLQ